MDIHIAHQICSKFERKTVASLRILAFHGHLNLPFKQLGHAYPYMDIHSGEQIQYFQSSSRKKSIDGPRMWVFRDHLNLQ